MINGRKYNFSPGPSQLPDQVLTKIQEELLNWGASGMSVMELSHRGKEFKEISGAAEQNLREVLQISDDYEVLFLQGGASLQMVMLPLNFASDKSADYLVTGQWSKKAYQEAARVADVNLAADGEADKYLKIPELSAWNLNENVGYLHFASNETIGGLQFKDFPEVAAPLVCDMSSDILSRHIDVNKFSLIYAGAQKNLGPAGVTLVIVKKDFLASAESRHGKFLNYQTHAESGSMYNTPPCFAWYVLGEVVKWVKEQGLEVVAKRNQQKADLLYNYIDATEFYSNPVNPTERSTMNIPFIIADEKLDSVFLEQSAAAGLLNLKGHRSVGGMRASIYNAMPVEGVQALIDFMKEFEQKNG